MKRNIILLIFILSIYSTLYSQYEEQFSLNVFESEIIDARSAALGKTSILSSRGSNYIFNNPAMLSDLSNKCMQISCSSKFGNSVRNMELEEYDYNDDNVFKYLINLKFDGISFSLPYVTKKTEKLKLGIGIGYKTFYDRSYKKSADNILTGIHTSSGNVFFEKIDYDYVSHGGFNIFVIGGGIKYLDKLYGGISFSIPLLSNSTSEYEDSENDEYKTETKYKGSFFTLSSTYKINNKMTIGIKFRNGFILEVEDVYQDNDGHNYESDIDYKIPLELGLSAELELVRNVSIYVEYLTRYLKKYEVVISFNDFLLYENSKNGFSFRTGLEVGSKLLYRCGFFLQSVPLYERKPLDVGDGYILDKNPQNEIGLTTGCGVKIKPNLSLDFFCIYTFLNYNESYFDHGGYIRSNEYSYKRFKIGFTTGYQF